MRSRGRPTPGDLDLHGATPAGSSLGTFSFVAHAFLRVVRPMGAEFLPLVTEMTQHIAASSPIFGWGH